MSAGPVAVVLGARGLVGSALTFELARAGWRIAAATAHAECDITDAGAVRALLAGARPTVVFNAAAYNDLLGIPIDRIEAVTSAQLPLGVPRPRRAILDNRALRALGLDTLSPWAVGLRAFLAAETAPG